MTDPVVAIVGVSGTLGPDVVKAFITSNAKVAYPIRLITSNEAKVKETIPETASSQLVRFYTSADVVSGKGLQEAFEGTDIVINLAGTSFSHDKIVDAVVAAKTKVYLPSEYGINLNDEFGPYDKLLDTKRKADKYLQAHKTDLKIVSVCTGIFTEWLFNIPGLGGITAETASTQYEPDSNFNTTSLPDIAKFIVAISEKSSSPESLPDKVYLSAAEINRAKVADIYVKVTQTPININENSKENLVQQATSTIAHGVNSAADFVVVLSAILNEGYGFYSKTNENAIIPGFKYETPLEVAKRVFK